MTRPPHLDAGEAGQATSRGRSLVATVFVVVIGLAGVLANASPSDAARVAVTASG